MARKDAKNILESGGFQTTITIENSIYSCTISGIAFTHHLAFDAENNPVNSKHAHVTISEQSLIDANYTVRKSDGNLFMRNHLVSYADSTGTVKKYVVSENFADETLGTITLMLKSFGN